jgi:hypothetical protein
MLRYLTSKIKNLRREKNHDAVKAIYRRGASTVPAESLTCHKEADRETKDRILAAAQARREQRNARRRRVSTQIVK